MALNAYDIQVCLLKMLKVSSKTCLTISMQHPYASSSFFFLFILYICFPLVFWILVYSLPLVVSTCLILSVSFSLRSNAKDGETEDKKISENSPKKQCGDDDDTKNKPYNRVHSVRRRRAKEIKIEEAHHNVEEKNTVSSTNSNCDIIDKNTLIQEIPKEIEVDIGQSNSSPPPPSILKQESDETNNPVRKLGILRDDEDEENKSFIQKNTMEVGVLDAERSKRLESLIARRRSRKMLSLQVRRSLLNMDRNDTNQIASFVLPKINTTTYSPNRMGGMFSPGPGSAPSVLIPMRNPFDLPYDPQEERPILTGDSFHQEFTLGKEAVYCRHESFSLGPSLFEDRDETSSVRDFGFRRCSTGFKFFRHGNESPGREFSPIHEQSKSNANIPDDDQIKEVIQVHQNDVAQSRHTDQEQSDLDESSQIPQSDFNYSSTSRSSSSSSSDQPVCKIDREAILKSLSSMRRNALLEIENNDLIGSLAIENNDGTGSDDDAIEIDNNDESESENNDRTGTYNGPIGSVEVENGDQIGSDSNLSYANSALENATRLKQQYYANKPAGRHRVSYSIASDMQVEVSEVSSPPITIDENMSYQDDQDVSWDGDDSWSAVARPGNDHDMIKGGDSTDRIQPSSEEASTIDLNDHQEQSLEPNVGDVRTSMISPKSVLLPTLSVVSFDPYVDHEEVHQSDALQNPTAVIEPMRALSRESGHSSKQDTEDSEAANSIDLYQSMDHSNNGKYHDGINEGLIPSMPTKEEEIVVGESKPHSTKTNSYEDHTTRSALDQETSTSSTFHQDFEADETLHVAVSKLAGDINFENACKNDEDRRTEQHADEQEAASETINTLENETTIADQSNLGVSTTLHSLSQNDHSGVLADDSSCFHLDK